MKLTAIKTTLLAAAAAASLSATTVPAHADIEDWLRQFGTRDFVGDWLRDTFGPVHYGDGNEGGQAFDSPSIHQKGYQEAVEVMVKWPKPKKQEGKVVQVCSGEKLLHVILETKSQDKTLETCFKPAK